MHKPFFKKHLAESFGKNIVSRTKIETRVDSFIVSPGLVQGDNTSLKCYQTYLLRTLTIEYHITSILEAQNSQLP